MKRDEKSDNVLQKKVQYTESNQKFKNKREKNNSKQSFKTNNESYENTREFNPSKQNILKKENHNKFNNKKCYHCGRKNHERKNCYFYKRMLRENARFVQHV